MKGSVSVHQDGRTYNRKYKIQQNKEAMKTENKLK